MSIMLVSVVEQLYKADRNGNRERNGNGDMNRNGDMTGLWST